MLEIVPGMVEDDDILFPCSLVSVLFPSLQCIRTYIQFLCLLWVDRVTIQSQCPICNNSTPTMMAAAQSQ